MYWEDIYEPDDEERDSPSRCEWCLEYFDDDEMTYMSVDDDDEDDEYSHICVYCKKHELALKNKS